ncbi:hypothetical protein WR25_10829 [Diploscapter pachys]|uniref:C2 NT-type domain-containing protein n=1 Tax=Diploscapter pachys TaxID=2018661 RepID=A0A2A2JAI7_9BILA|nr:hypothetical protein WR25_10829 [Diploscapter pachys]
MTITGTYFLIRWLWHHRMSFLKNRKGFKFNVDLQVTSISDVPLVNAVLFAKVRLLEGGSFEDATERVDVSNHGASFSHRFSFSCKIPSDPLTGILERCNCRISVRKEQRGGRSYAKLGYVDVNLAEFAASGVEGISRSYLLSGYSLNQRQDNSKVQIKVTMNHQSADPFFRVPRIAGQIEDRNLNPLDRKAPQVAGDDETTAVVFRNQPTEAESSSIAASASTANDDSPSESQKRSMTTSVTSSTTTGAPTLRRLSQDRSNAPRVQSTRIDAGCVIDKMLEESRIADEAAGELEDDERDGLSLYVDREGRPIVGGAPSNSTHNSLSRSGHIHLPPPPSSTSSVP